MINLTPKYRGGPIGEVVTSPSDYYANNDLRRAAGFNNLPMTTLYTGEVPVDLLATYIGEWVARNEFGVVTGPARFAREPLRYTVGTIAMKAAVAAANRTGQQVIVLEGSRQAEAQGGWVATNEHPHLLVPADLVKPHEQNTYTLHAVNPGIGYAPPVHPETYAILVGNEGEI